MKYKLLVLDIDGTVTNSQKEVTKKTKEAIVRLQERGIPVAIASGRPPQGVYKVAEELEFQKFGSYILPFNGARILNYKTRECVYEKTLPQDFRRSCGRTQRSMESESLLTGGMKLSPALPRILIWK